VHCNEREKLHRADRVKGFFGSHFYAQSSDVTHKVLFVISAFACRHRVSLRAIRLCEYDIKMRDVREREREGERERETVHCPPQIRSLKIRDNVHSSLVPFPLYVRYSSYLIGRTLEDGIRSRGFPRDFSLIVVFILAICVSYSSNLRQR